jgi:trehalose 6-phosphate synthase
VRVTKRSSFVVVANRLPVDEVTDESGTRWQRSPGGLVTALHPVLVARQGTWVGWSGAVGPAPAPFEIDGIAVHPIPLDADEFERYYEGQSNATIWPLYHDAV